MLGKLRLLSATGMLLAVTSAGALAADSLAQVPVGLAEGQALTEEIQEFVGRVINHAA